MLNLLSDLFTIRDQGKDKVFQNKLPQDTGLQDSDTIDTLMKKVDEGGVQLSEVDKANLKAFLLSLSDPSFLNNPAFLPQ